MDNINTWLITTTTTYPLYSPFLPFSYPKHFTTQVSIHKYIDTLMASGSSPPVDMVMLFPIKTKDFVYDIWSAVAL